jgi:hypothetical protein
MTSELSTEDMKNLRLLGRYILVYGEMPNPVVVQFFKDGPHFTANGDSLFHLSKLYAISTLVIGKEAFYQINAIDWKVTLWMEPKTGVFRSVTDISGKKIRKRINPQDYIHFKEVYEMLKRIRPVYTVRLELALAFWLLSYGRLSIKRPTPIFEGNRESFERDMLMFRMDDLVIERYEDFTKI